MVKVVGPMHSDSASGSFAGSQVHANWKGVKYVRALVTPKNPQNQDQADVRLVFGGVGRACKVVQATSDYEGQLITLQRIPAGQTKQSFMVKQIIDAYASDVTAYEALVTEYEAHTAKAAFESEAAGLGLADFNISYNVETSPFTNGLMLYCLAKLAIDQGFTGEPYTTALASWTASEIQAMVDDFAAAV